MTILDDRSHTKTERRVRLESPIGALVLSGTAEAVTGLLLPNEARNVAAAPKLPSRPGVLREAAHQLDQYFAGKRRRFELPLALRGTEFQKLVWTTLADIPYGETISYAELARWVGRPYRPSRMQEALSDTPRPALAEGRHGAE